MGLIHQLMRDAGKAYQAAQRDLNRSQLASQQVQIFNARWERLNSYADRVTPEFYRPLWDSGKMTTKEVLKLGNLISEMHDLRHAINDEIEHAQQKHLSQYATSIKNALLNTAKLCKKYSVLRDLKSVRYDAPTKSIMINERETFYFGS